MENQSASANGPEFNISRIYIKDLSYEAPNVPQQFLNPEYKPKIDLELNSLSNPLNDGAHEVVLRVMISAKQDDKTVFLLEVQYAGVFVLRGFPEDQIKPMLGSYCPNLLFPYVREIVDNLISRGGFPALYLAPVNFDALYAQYVQRMEQDSLAKQNLND